MKKGYLVFLIFTFTIGINSYGQIINKDLSVDYGDFKIEISKTSLTEIKEFFKQDSIIDVENDKSYVLRNNNLIFSFWDKNDDNIVDGVDFNNNVSTWNGISINCKYSDFIKKNKIEKVLIDYDNGDKIVCTISNENSNVAMGFYFSGDFHVNGDEESEQVLFEMLKKNSSVVLISIFNPY